MAVIDLQQVASSAYNTIIGLNQSATEMVGLDAIWCRLLPFDKGEDVIVQEYTLHSYDCPRNIKVVCNNTSYNVGNFAIDLFGIKNTEQLEISVDLTAWKTVYGEEAIPQKGDFVLISTMHRAYEVVSSAPVHTIGQLITSWKCILGEWKHAASRLETEDFKISIDELTVSQDRLFGETISKEVADTVAEVETSYNTTTYVDPIKDFEIDTVVPNKVVGNAANIIANAYYDFSKSTKPITYKLDAAYDPECIENHWIFSCWFKADLKTISQSVKINGIYLKDKDYWWFDVASNMKLEQGMGVYISRGSQVKLEGVVEQKDCKSGWTVRVSTSQCLLANKKIPNFWQSGIWKISLFRPMSLLSCYNGEEEVMGIRINESNADINIGGQTKKVSFDSKIIAKDWHYIAFDICPSSVRTVLCKTFVSENKHVDKLLYDNTMNINIKTFSFDSASIDNMGLNCCMTNIRLYENEYPLNDTYRLDMYSEVTRNASKLILVDVPNAANDMSFISRVR